MPEVLGSSLDQDSGNPLLEFRNVPHFPQVKSITVPQLTKNNILDTVMDMGWTTEGSGFESGQCPHHLDRLA
jgi:hypothetical protein